MSEIRRFVVENSDSELVEVWEDGAEIKGAMVFPHEE